MVGIRSFPFWGETVSCRESIPNNLGMWDSLTKPSFVRGFPHQIALMMGVPTQLQPLSSLSQSCIYIYIYPNFLSSINLGNFRKWAQDIQLKSQILDYRHITICLSKKIWQTPSHPPWKSWVENLSYRLYTIRWFFLRNKNTWALFLEDSSLRMSPQTKCRNHVWIMYELLECISGCWFQPIWKI